MVTEKTRFIVVKQNLNNLDLHFFISRRLQNYNRPLVRASKYIYEKKIQVYAALFERKILLITHLDRLHCCYFDERPQNYNRPLETDTRYTFMKAGVKGLGD